MEIKCRYDELLAIDLVKVNPKNRNIHPEYQIVRLCELLKYQGFRHPLIISKTSGLLVVGHGRFMAARKLGMKTVPVVYQEFLNKEQEYAFGVSDNAIASWAELDLSGIHIDLPDFDSTLLDIEMLGIEDFQFEPTVEPQCDEDAVPEKVEAKTRLGDLYKLGEHRLLCGDSTNIQHVERLMDGNKADMVFTDPPYGINIDGQKESKNANPKYNRKAHEFRGWDNKRPDEGIFNYIVALNIPSVIFGGNYFADLLPASRGWIYWSKGQDGLTMSDGELAWTNLNKPLRSVVVNRAAIGKSVHPTQKPIPVIEFCLEYIGEAPKVLDLFGGSGSTLIACEKTNRKCFMMELDPHYCDVIVARWEKYTGKKTELLKS